MKNALISIKPEYAERILSGAKVYEYRKSVFSEQVCFVYLYATEPVGRIVGKCKVMDIHRNTPEVIWEFTGWQGGISKLDFARYFEGYEQGYAIRLKPCEGDFQEVDPRSIASWFKAPRSFIYLADSFAESIDKLATRKGGAQ